MQPPTHAVPPLNAALLTAAVAEDMTRRALANIAREYPNHPQLLLDAADGVLDGPGPIGERDLLMTMHGMFWRFPRTFSAANAAGIRARSAYLKVIGDFWRSEIARHDRRRLSYAVWSVLSRRPIGAWIRPS